MFDFYRVYISLFGLMFISQKKQRGERNNFILHGSGKKDTLVKSMLQYPNISPFCSMSGNINAAFMLLEHIYSI